jgi:hypothetical protein
MFLPQNSTSAFFYLWYNLYADALWSDRFSCSLGTRSYLDVLQVLNFDLRHVTTSEFHKCLISIYGTISTCSYHKIPQVLFSMYGTISTRTLYEAIASPVALVELPTSKFYKCLISIYGTLLRPNSTSA